MDSRRSKSSVDLEESKKLTVSKKLFIIDLIVVISMTCIATISVVHYLTSELDTAIIEKITVEWGNSPFFEFALPNNEEKKNTIFKELSGGKEVCVCTDENKKDTYHFMNCYDIEDNSTCVQRDYFPDIIVLNWGWNKFLHEFPPNYVHEYTYTNLFWSLNTRIVTQNEKCPDGFKKCGIIDTLNQTLCIVEDYNCPCNYLHETPNLTLPWDGYGIQPITPNKYMFLSRDNINGTIWTQFTIETNFPCIHPKEEISVFANYSFLTRYETYKFPCQTKYFNRTQNDYHYKILSEITMRDILRGNSNPDDVIAIQSHHEYYSNIMNTTVKLYAKPYHGFRVSCFERYGGSEGIKYINPNTTENYKNAKFSLLISCVFLILSVACTISIMFLYFSTKCIMIIRTVITILMFINFLLLICASLFLNFHDYTTYECGDEIISEVMLDINQRIYTNQVILWTTSALTFPVFLLQLSGIFIQKKKNIEIANTSEIKTEYMLD